MEVPAGTLLCLASVVQPNLYELHPHWISSSFFLLPCIIYHCRYRPQFIYPLFLPTGILSFFQFGAIWLVCLIFITVCIVSWHTKYFTSLVVSFSLCWNISSKKADNFFCLFPVFLAPRTVPDTQQALNKYLLKECTIECMIPSAIIYGNTLVLVCLGLVLGRPRKWFLLWFLFYI